MCNVCDMNVMGCPYHQRQRALPSLPCNAEVEDPPAMVVLVLVL